MAPTCSRGWAGPARTPDGRILHFLGTGAMVLGDFTAAPGTWHPPPRYGGRRGVSGCSPASLAGTWPRIYLGQLDQARAESEEG